MAAPKLQSSSRPASKIPKASRSTTLFVYFTEHNANDVKKVPKLGGAATLVAANQTTPFNVVVDAKAIYWTNEATPGQVMKLAK